MLRFSAVGKVGVRIKRSESEVFATDRLHFIFHVQCFCQA